MKKIYFLFILVMSNIISIAGNLPYSNGIVIPTPIKQSKNKKLAIDPASIKIKISASPVKSITLGKKILLEKLNSLPKNNDGREIFLTIAKVNDVIWKDTVFSEIKTLPAQAYKLVFVEKDNKLSIYAVGADNRGVFYAIASLIQLFYKEQGKAFVNATDITDNPSWLKRYIGGYSPISIKQYKSLAAYKISGYGIQHRYDWKQFSPEKRPKYYNKKTYQQAFDDIKQFRQDNGDLVDTMLLLNIYKGKRKINLSNASEVKSLTDKCLWAAKYVQHIMIQVDDATPHKGDKYILLYPGEQKMFKSAGDAHGYLVKKIYSKIKEKHPSVKISFCGAPYSLNRHSASSPDNKKYLADLAKQLPVDVSVVWTGAVVESASISAETHAKYKALVQDHPLLLWDNTSNMRGVPINIWKTKFFPEMTEEDSSTIYINGHGFSSFWSWIFSINANDYLWNPQNYNSSKSYSQIYFELKGNKIPDFVFQTREDILKLALTRNRASKAKIAKDMLMREEDFKANNLSFRRIKRIAQTAYNNSILKVSTGSVPRILKDFDINSDKADMQWEKIPELKLDKSDKEIKYPTTVKIAYTPRNIYMQFNCMYSQKPTSNIKASKRDYSLRKSPDHIIIGLQTPMKSQRAGWLRVDIAGSIYDNVEWANAKKFNPKLEIKRQLLDDHWILTVKIPIIQLKPHIFWRYLKRGDKWRVNFIRVNNIDHEISSWSPVSSKGIEHKKFFGNVTFK